MTAAFAAASMSASPSTMNGSEPPSSSTTFFMCRPATSPTAEPAFSDPVTDTPWTRGSAMHAATWAEEMNALRYTPSGSPASVQDPFDRRARTAGSSARA